MTCAVCGKELTAAENAAVDSDVDFVEHGDPAHLIRRVSGPLSKVYCFDGAEGLDPHAVVVNLNADDVLAWNQQRAKETRLPRHATGMFVPVTDQATGKRYMVATAPCGIGCRCAAVAIEGWPS